MRGGGADLDAVPAPAVARSPVISGLRLSALSVPALVLHGDRDPMVPISGGQRTAAVIPGARFEVLCGMGHDHPPAYWPAIVELVTGHATSAVASSPGRRGHERLGPWIR